MQISVAADRQNMECATIERTRQLKQGENCARAPTTCHSNYCFTSMHKETRFIHQ